jgi:hypothetical protein
MLVLSIGHNRAQISSLFFIYIGPFVTGSTTDVRSYAMGSVPGSWVRGT